MGKLKPIVKLLTHKVTWRFLILLAGALGLASATDNLSTLETLVCSLVACVD